MAGVVKSMEAAAKSMDLQKVREFVVITFWMIPHMPTFIEISVQFWSHVVVLNNNELMFYVYFRFYITLNTEVRSPRS